MSVNPGLVSRVAAAIAHADRKAGDVSYDKLAEAAIAAVSAWIENGVTNQIGGR